MKEKLLKYKPLQTFLDAKDFTSVMKLMSSWNNEQLAELLFHFPHLLEQFRLPEFEDFWETWRDKLRLPNTPDFRFMPQPGIKDADLVIGYVLFLLELKSKDATDERGDTEVDMKPTDYLSIHSIRHKLHQIYVVIEQANETDLEHLTCVLYNLEAFAKLHQCPGYLLLANGYMQLALRYQQMRNTEPCTASFQLCWKFLHLAALSEPHSEESINNAYFGKGLSRSNPFRLESIVEMKGYCRKAAADLLPLDLQNGAEKAASVMYQHTQKMKDLAGDVSPSLGM